MTTLFDNFKQMEDCLDVDKRLYWAGRMSIAIDILSRSTPKNMSANMKLLTQCKEEYDNLIFNEAYCEKTI